MPKINVYLPDDLADAVRQAHIPVSSVCQQALADAVASADGPPLAGKGAPTGSGDLSRLSRRARLAVEQAKAASPHPTSVGLVDGIVGEGNNLALAVLRALDVEPDDLVAEVRGASTRSDASADALGAVLGRAVEQAHGLGHNYVGCEHLLLGLAAGPPGELVADTLRLMGVDLARAQQGVSLMMAGFAYASDNGLHAGLSTSLRSALEEIRVRLSHIDSHHAAPH